MDFNNLIEVINHFSDPQNCLTFLEEIRWNGNVICTSCKADSITKLKGKTKRFKCRKCGKQFSVIKGTIFEKTKIPLQKWFLAVYFITAHKKGISSIQLAKNLGVTQKTAWFMAQRIRHALKIKTSNMIDGVVQVDETFVGGKNKNRPLSKKIAHSQGRSLKDKTPVFGIVKVGGEVYTQVIPNTKSKTIRPIIEERIAEGSIIISDEWWAYNNLGKKYKHVQLKHKEEEYIRGAFHNNTIEGFWSLLKRGLYGIYHQVSAKHLDKYCDEFSYRYNTRKLKDSARFNHTMRRIDCRLTLKELTKK